MSRARSLGTSLPYRARLHGMATYVLAPHERCAGRTKLGKPCGAAHIPSSPYCLFHEPSRAAEVHAARVRGAHAANNGRIVPDVSALVVLDLTKPEELATFRQGVMSLVLSGHLEPAAARAGLECAQLIVDSGKAADASESTLAMTRALAAALREQG